VKTYSYARPTDLESTYARFARDLTHGAISATALHVEDMPSGRVHIGYTDPTEVLTVFNTDDYGGDWEAALADALDAGGVLEFGLGAIVSSTPIVLTRHIEIRGFGFESRFRYTGTGYAVRMEFTDSNVGEGTYIHDLRISGNDTEGQGGIAAGANDVVPRMVRVERVRLDGFLGGTALFMKIPYSCTVAWNTVEGARVGIEMRGMCGCRVIGNQVNYWANFALYLYSVQGDGLAPRNNRVAENVIHGNVSQAQDVPQHRAAIRVDGVSSLVVDDNYIVGIASPPSGAFVGRGVWLTKSAVPLTQDVQVSNQYFGPGTTGHHIYIESGVTQADVHSNSSCLIFDEGSFTKFDQHLAAYADVTGTSTSRRGWLRLSTVSGGVLQLHA
jgi:hypothetical protein